MKTPQKTAQSIRLSKPYPLLDPGQYIAYCPEATFDWAKQFQKWIARLVLEPQNYQGRPYIGRLCKFMGLGRGEQPFAGPQSDFRRLYVEVNAEQPTNPEALMSIFEGRFYDIKVETVTKDRGTKERAPQDRPPEHWYSIVREIHPLPPTLQPSNLEPFNPLTLRTESTYTTDQHSNTENTPLAISTSMRDFSSIRGVRR